MTGVQTCALPISLLNPGAESPPRNVSGYDPTGPNSHVGGSALSLPRANRGIFGLSTYTPCTPSPPRRKYSDEVEKWVSYDTIYPYYVNLFHWVSMETFLR